ncbi:MAG: type II toxin-antitoxin system HicA family toxin [Chloroflexi bacterium]|nr:type II toxin-antitoxin system HicA family toxin [Chloroflexota bacterium]
MTSYPPYIWAQLKNLSCDQLSSALLKDGWVFERGKGAVRQYIKGDGLHRVAVHYHPHKTYGPQLLRDLLKDIGWTEADLKRLKLIK